MLYATSQPLIELHPDAIHVERVSILTLKRLQREMSKAVWRPAPGRGLAFIVLHYDTLLGLLYLASPIINLGPRNAFLGLSSDPIEKGKQLRNYVDLSVCVGVQPLAWYWNLGKLCALLAPTLGDVFYSFYQDELKGVITTSLWGKGSQYNRVYKLLGYTKGYGHEHITTAEYRKMIWWLKREGYGEVSCKSNKRMSNIQRYVRFSHDETRTPFHGKVRGIYYHAAVDPMSREQVIRDWYERWGKPRYERKQFERAPYLTGVE